MNADIISTEVAKFYPILGCVHYHPPQGWSCIVDKPYPTFQEIKWLYKIDGAKMIFHTFKRSVGTLVGHKSMSFPKGLLLVPVHFYWIHFEDS